MEDLMMAEASCHNGICAVACGVACLIGGVALVAWGALGGVVGAWEGPVAADAY